MKSSPRGIGLTQNNLNMTSHPAATSSSTGWSPWATPSSYDLDDLTLFLTLADKKGQVFDYDLEALAFFSQIRGA